MAKKIKIDGKTYNVSYLARMVEKRSTTLERMDVPDRVKRSIERKLKKNKQEEANEVFSLFGKIKRETEKAVLFSVFENWNGQEQALLVGEYWFPKSQAHVLEDVIGGADQIDVATWLIEKKRGAA